MNRIESLQIEIQKIQALGKVAPKKTWISSYNVSKKNGKRYTYYRLMGNHPSGKGSKLVCYLGSKESKAYKAMVLAIARRNEILKMEREVARLEQLERVGGGKKINKPQPTYLEKTSILQLQTQLNQVVKALEELKAQQGELSQKIERLRN